MALGDVLSGAKNVLGSISPAIASINPWVGAGLGLLGAGAGALAHRYGSGTSSPRQDVQRLASGVGSGLGNFLTGQRDTFQQVPRYSPSQMAFLENQILPLLQQQIGQTGTQAQFGPIKQEALRRFSEEGIPSIAERFTRMTGGALSSPALYSQLGAARTGLESQLSALEQQFNQQNAGINQNLLNLLLTAGLQPQFETAYRPGSPGFLQSAGQAAGQIAPSLLYNWATAPRA